MTHKPWNSVIVHLGLTVLLSIAVTAALILVQATRTVSDDREETFTERLKLATMQVEERLRTAEDLQLAGAIVLSEQEALLDALSERDLTQAVAAGARLAQATAIESPGIGRQGLTLYDPDGALLVRIHSPLNRQQDGIATLVSTAIRTGAPTVGLRTDELFGPAVSGAAPLIDADGTLLGVLEVVVALDTRFAETVANVVGATIAVLDPERTVGASEPGVEIDPAALVNLRVADGPQVLTFGGGEYLADSVPLLGADGEWVGEVYVGLNRAEVHAAAADTRADIIRSVLIALAGGLIVAAVIGALTTRPLRNMMHAANRIRENDLDTPVSPRGPRELRALAAAMDEMRIAVRESREDLMLANERLAERVAVSDAGLSVVTTELSVLNAIVTDLAGDAGGGLPDVAEQLTRLDWIDGALIALLDESGHLVLAAEAGGDTDAVSAILALAQREAMLLGDGVLISDITRHDRFVGLLPHGVASLALVPIATPAGTAGMIGAYARRPTPYSGGVELLRTVTQEILGMLERSELVGEAEEHRYLAEAVLRGMSDGIVVLDAELRCRVCNPAAARMLGVPTQEALGAYAETWLPLSPPLLAQLRQRGARQPNQPSAPIVAEVGGRELAIHAGPFEEPGAAASGLILLIQDLSAIGEAEQLKQDFVSMVGHELRTPLTMIRTTIDLLAEDPERLDDSQRRLVDVLGTHSERLLRLINDLLDMSALDSGQMRVQPITVNLADALRHVVDQQRARAAEAGVSVTVQTPDTLLAWADRTRIEQVVGNLVQNAIKYTPDGGSITVRAQDREEHVRVDVIDTGIGIAPAEQAHLFEKFYRAESGRRRSGGTGLGLAIARSIVELHGGEIWCESDGSSGTTFSFTLPRRSADEGAVGRIEITETLPRADRPPERQPPDGATGAGGAAPGRPPGGRT